MYSIILWKLQSVRTASSERQSATAKDSLWEQTTDWLPEQKLVGINHTQSNKICHCFFLLFCFFLFVCSLLSPPPLILLMWEMLRIIFLVGRRTEGTSSVGLRHHGNAVNFFEKLLTWIEILWPHPVNRAFAAWSSCAAEAKTGEGPRFKVGMFLPKADRSLGSQSASEAMCCGYGKGRTRRFFCLRE